MGTLGRYSWSPSAVGHPGVTLHSDGSITLGARRYGPTEGISIVRLAPFTFNKPAGADQELSGVSDKGEMCAFRFDSAGRVWLQKFLWKTLPPDFNAGAFRLAASGEIVFFDGAVARAGFPFAKRMRIGGVSMEVSSSARSPLVVVQSTRSIRQYAWEGGVWHQLFGYFPVTRSAPGAIPPHRAVAISSPTGPPVPKPCLPEPVWRRHPIERIGDAAGSNKESHFVAIGQVSFLNDGTVVLGNRAFPGGSEIRGFRFGAHIAHRAAGANQILIIDTPDGDSSCYCCQGKWYRYVPIASRQNIMAYHIAETMRQCGYLFAPIPLLLEVIVGAVILALSGALVFVFFWFARVGAF